MAQLQGIFEADFSAFYDAVQKATYELKSFEAGAGDVEARLKRMADSFSGQKVVQDATLMAKAIADAGGASTLTEKELARVSRTAQEAVDKLLALGKDVPPEIQKLADATRGAGDQTKNLSVSVTDMVKAYVSAEAILKVVGAAYDLLVGGMKDAIAAAMEAEDNDQALLAALQAQGTAIPTVVSAYNDYASALQGSTKYSDDAVKSAQTLLVTIGNVMPKDMEKALKATTNLAAGLGKDLPEAAMMVAKAAQGNTESLGKYVAGVEDANGKSKDLAGVLDAVNSSFRGAAEAAGATMSGRLEQLKNSWGDVQESIGRVITNNASVRELFAGITGLLQTNTEELNKNASANNLVSDTVILLAKTASAAAGGFDIFYTALQNVRKGVDTFAKDLGYAYLIMQKIEEWTQRQVWEKTGSEAAAKRMREAGEAIAWANEQLNELDVDMAKADKDSAAWSATMADLKAQIDATTAKMEAARGKTVEGAAATTAAANATALHTRELEMYQQLLGKVGPEQEAATKKHAAAVAELASISSDYRVTVQGMNVDLVAIIESSLQAGASQATLATAYGLTELQVKAVSLALKEKIETQKREAQEIALVARLQAEYQKLIGQGSRDLLQAELDRIQKTYEADVKALEARKVKSQEAYDLLEAMANKAAENAIKRALESDPASRAYWEKRVDDAQVAYERVQQYADQYTAEELAIRATRLNQAETDLANWTLHVGGYMDGLHGKIQQEGGQAWHGWSAAAEAAMNSAVIGGQQAAQSVGAVNAAVQQLQQGMSAVQSGAQLQLPQGPKYTGDLVPVFGVGGYLGRGPSGPAAPDYGAIYQHGRPMASGGIVRKPTLAMIGEAGPEAVIPLAQLTSGGGSSGITINIATGAVQMNYPIMDDPRAKDQIGRLVGDAILARLTRSGARV